MAQIDVPATFYKAKYQIEHHAGTGSPIDFALAGWTSSDKITFARWYRNEQKAQRAETVARQMRPAFSAMAPRMYIPYVQSSILTGTASVIRFIKTTQSRDWASYPRPIVLGSEDGNVYQLRSQLLDLEPSCDLPAGAVSSNAFTEIRPTKPNTECPLRFVLPLGLLEYIRVADSSRVETPFHVCVNPVDLSIWLILASYTLDDLGDRMPISRGTDPWPYLGLHSYGRVQFDVMELMTANDFQGLQNQEEALKRDMFGAAEEATQVWPTAWVPTKDAVEALVPRTSFVANDT